MAQIDTLTIQVKANGIAAAKGIDKLTAALEKMNAAVNAGGMVRVVNETKTLGKVAEKTEKQTSKFGASLIRIAKYRMLRTVLKNITQGLSEGIKNLYAYSEAMNSADAAANKNTMDQYASSLLYLKNAVGAAVAPLLQALLPVVQQLVEWFVAGANAVNQFISALQGKSTFTKAVYNMAEFGEQTAKAGAAAKELKKTVMGFDELNLLQVDNGRGGGGADSTPDYSKMFEESKLDGWAQKISDLLKPFTDWFNGLSTAEQIALGIGSAIALWKIPGLVLDFFKNLGSTGWSVVGGIALLVSGMTVQWESANDIQENGLNLKNAITSLLGMTATAAGVSILAGAVGVSGPVGWALGIGVALVAEIVALNVALDEKRHKRFMETDLGIALAEVQQEIDENAKINIDLSAEVEALEIDTSNLEKIEQAKELIEKIFALDETEIKTPGQIEELKGAIEELNGLEMPGIFLSFDEATGKVNGTKEAILGVIQALELQYRIEANKDALVEAYRLQQEAANNVKKNSKTQKKAEQDLYDAATKYNTTMERQRKIIAEIEAIKSAGGDTWSYDDEALARVSALEDEYYENFEALKQLDGETKNYKSTLDRANQELESSIEIYENASGKVDEFETELYELTGQEKDSSKETDTLGVNTDELRLNIENASSAADKFANGDYEGALQDIGGATEDATDSTSNYKNELSDTRQKVVNLKSTTDVFGNQIDKYGNTVDTATGKTKNFGTTVKNIDGNLVNAKGEVIQLHDAMQKLVQMRVEKMASADAIAEMNTKLKAVHAEVDAITKGLDIKTSADVEAIINLREELYKARMEAYMLTGYKPVLSKNQQKKADEIMMSGILGIDAYASGGWPDEGELFLAREAGAGPEMVGTIGGRTAVANNQDIVAAVADGVFNAVMSANSGSRNSGGDIHVTLQLGEYELANAVVSALNNQTRRIGYSQLEGI